MPITGSAARSTSLSSSFTVPAWLLAGNREITGRVDPPLPAMSYNTSKTVFGEEGPDIMHDNDARLGARLVLIGLVATTGLLITACGGGSRDSGPTGGAATTSTTAGPSGSSGSSGSGSGQQARETEELRLARCMRSHGVPDFPDPGSGGGLLHAISAAGINTRSASYQAALQACKKYTPAGTLSPGESAAQNAEGLRFSQC